MFNIRLSADRYTLFCELAICFRDEEIQLIINSIYMLRLNDTYRAGNALGSAQLTQLEVGGILLDGQT